MSKMPKPKETPRPTKPTEPTSVGIVHTEAGDAIKVSMKALRCFGTRVDEWEDSWVFKNGSKEPQNVKARKCFPDECLNPVEAAQDLIKIVTRQELEIMVESVVLQYGTDNVKATFEKSVNKKMTRGQLEEYVYKTQASCEAVFAVASISSLHRYLEDKGWSGIKDANKMTLRCMALSLACRLFRKDWLRTVKSMGSNNVELGVFVNPCQRCVDRKHDPRKCRETQSWLRQGFPMDIVVPKATSHNTSKSTDPLQAVTLEDGTKAVTERKFNSRQRKEMKRNREEFAYCHLTEDDLRLLHWQVTHSQKRWDELVDFMKKRQTSRLPDDLRAIQKNIDYCTKTSKDPEIRRPEIKSFSAVGIPQLLLQEVMAIGFGLVPSIEKLDEFQTHNGNPMRECQKQFIGFVNVSAYDPHVLHLTEEDAPGWRDTDKREPPPAPAPKKQINLEAVGGGNALPLTVVDTPTGPQLSANVGPIKGATVCGKCGAPATELETKFTLQTDKEGRVIMTEGAVVSQSDPTDTSTGAVNSITGAAPSHFDWKSHDTEVAKKFWAIYSQDTFNSWTIFEKTEAQMVEDGEDPSDIEGVKMLIDIQLQNMSAHVTGAPRRPRDMNPKLKKDWATSIQMEEAVLSKEQSDKLHKTMADLNQVIMDKVDMARKYMIPVLPEPAELFTVFIEDVMQEILDARNEYLSNVQKWNAEERTTGRPYHETGARPKNSRQRLHFLGEPGLPNIHSFVRQRKKSKKFGISDVENLMAAVWLDSERVKEELKAMPFADLKQQEIREEVGVVTRKRIPASLGIEFSIAIASFRSIVSNLFQDYNSDYLDATIQWENMHITFCEGFMICMCDEFHAVEIVKTEDFCKRGCDFLSHGCWRKGAVKARDYMNRAQPFVDPAICPSISSILEKMRTSGTRQNNSH